MNHEVEPSMFFGLIALFVGLVALNATLIAYYSSDYAVLAPVAAQGLSTTASK